MAFEQDVVVTIPILVGLAGIAFAILERGYKRFLEEKKKAEAENKTLVFDMAYIINMVISGGVTSAFVSAIPLLVEAVGAPQQVTFISLLLNAVTGYTLAYRILDGLNNSTDTTIKTAKLISKAKSIKKQEQEEEEDTKSE